MFPASGTTQTVPSDFQPLSSPSSCRHCNPHFYLLLSQKRYNTVVLAWLQSWKTSQVSFLHC